MIEPFKVGISYLKCVNYETYSDNLVTLFSSKARNFAGKTSNKLSRTLYNVKPPFPGCCEKRGKKIDHFTGGG